MEDEIEECIRKKVQWAQLPGPMKKLLGDSAKEYERYIFEFSIKNQLRYRGSLVRTVRKDERKYYEALIQSSIQRLMLYPYHLADMIVKGLRITPFIYYVEVVALLIELEKSYDTMPNFTAADCLRLLGIGRNEYLELVAKARSLGRRGRYKAIRGLLPKVPLNIPMQPWWRVELGYVLEEDVKPLSESERALIDLLIDRGSQTAGTLDYNTVKTLYRRGLIYLDVPITSADKVSVPPLKGFVMNRIAGDYFETLLYKVFVSIDEHTSITDLAAVLQVECELVKQAVSLYCRLGFANNLQPPPISPQHPSWKEAVTTHRHQPYSQISPLTPTFEQSMDDDAIQMEPVLITQTPSTSRQSYQETSESLVNNAGQRVAVLFDSTLAAYLMMGNLSPDLKSHAVTLFEVGKLCDESLDSLLMELDKVVADPEIEGEARRYLAAAACLRLALRTLRPGLRPLDLLRCEALHALGAPARTRLLTTKYRLAISTAPLCREARAGAAAAGLPHVGPAPHEAASPWMRLYLYHVAGYGPPTLLLTKGTHLRGVPRLLLGYSRLSVWWWGAEGGGEGGALPAAAALAAANSALRRAPVLLQAAGVRLASAARHLPFPPRAADTESQVLWTRHAGLRRLLKRLHLSRNAGYVTLADIGVPDLGCAKPPTNVQLVPPRRRKDICGIAKPVTESVSSTDTDDKTRLQSPIESHFAVTPTTESKTSSPANGFTSIESNQLLCEELDNLALNDPMKQSKESISCIDDLVPIHSSSTSIDDKSDDGKKVSRIPDELPDSNSLNEMIPAYGERNSIPQYNDLLSPAEESISMFTQLSDKLAEMSTEDSGVDTAHNVSDEETCRPEKWTILDLQFGIPLFDEAMCESICNCIVERIAKPELLDKIKEDNEFLCSDVLKFVSQCQASSKMGSAQLLQRAKELLAISTAPLCREARAGAAAAGLPHVGPAPHEAASPWMRLYLYHVAGYGPPTLLLTKGTHLRGVPRLLLGYSRLSVWWWGAEGGGEGGALPAAAALAAANSALRRAPVLLQAAGVRLASAARHLPFPPRAADTESQVLWTRHAGLRRLLKRLHLSRNAGYVTLADIGVPDLGCAKPPTNVQLVPPRRRKDICGIAKPVTESVSSTDTDDKTRLQSPIESHFAVTPTTESKTSSPANGFTSIESNQLLCEELDNLALNDPMKQSKESISCIDDLVPIHSSSTSIDDKSDDGKKVSRTPDELPDSNSLNEMIPAYGERNSIPQYNDLLSPAEESISMFTQLSDKLAEMSTEDSGVDTAHNVSDEETCRPEKWTILDLQFGIPLFDEAMCESICNCIVERIAKPELLDKIKEDNEFLCSDVLKFVSQCQYYPGEDMGIVKRGTLVPLPRKNLAFENGKITEWAGK